jgi:hypothetical protein
MCIAMRELNVSFESFSGRDYYFPGDGFGYGYGLAVRVSREMQTAVTGLDRRTQMGHRQRHIFRRRSQTEHGLPPDGADPAGTLTHYASLQALVYDAFGK